MIEVGPSFVLEELPAVGGTLTQTLRETPDLIDFCLPIKQRNGGVGGENRKSTEHNDGNVGRGGVM